MNPHKFILENKRSTCQCGKPNNCAIEQGKSISACWCYGEDFTNIEPSQESICHCRDCLNKLKRV